MHREQGAERKMNSNKIRKKKKKHKSEILTDAESIDRSIFAKRFLPGASGLHPCKRALQLRLPRCPPTILAPPGTWGDEAQRRRRRRASSTSWCSSWWISWAEGRERRECPVVGAVSGIMPPPYLCTLLSLTLYPHTFCWNSQAASGFFYYIYFATTPPLLQLYQKLGRDEMSYYSKTLKRYILYFCQIKLGRWWWWCSSCSSTGHTRVLLSGVCDRVNGWMDARSVRDSEEKRRKATGGSPGNGGLWGLSRRACVGRRGTCGQPRPSFYNSMGASLCGVTFFPFSIFFSFFLLLLLLPHLSGCAFSCCATGHQPLCFQCTVVARVILLWLQCICPHRRWLYYHRRVKLEQ